MNHYTDDWHGQEAREESAFTPAQPATKDDNHGGRGWEATETGWRCTECHHGVAVVDVNIDAAHRCAPASEVPAVFNVKDYGAKGDGITDDTAAIQAAHDAVLAAGIERVLGEHVLRARDSRCSCDTRGPAYMRSLDGQVTATQRHIAHVASQVIAYLHRKEQSE